MDIKKDKLFLILGIVLVLGLIALVVFMRPEPVDQELVEDPNVQDFPVLFEQRDDLLFEERITKVVSELKRSPAAHFNINISGTVRGFFDRTIIVEAMNQTLEIPVPEGSVVVTEVWPEIPIPEQIAELPAEDFILFDLLMNIEQAQIQELLPDAELQLQQLRTIVEEKVAEVPAEEMRGFLGAPVPVVPGEPVLEPFELENISIGDIVRIRANITPIGELQAFEVIVQQID